MVLFVTFSTCFAFDIHLCEDSFQHLLDLFLEKCFFFLMRATSSFSLFSLCAACSFDVSRERDRVSVFSNVSVGSCSAFNLSVLLQQN